MARTDSFSNVMSRSAPAATTGALAGRSATAALGEGACGAGAGAVDVVDGAGEVWAGDAPGAALAPVSPDVVPGFGGGGNIARYPYQTINDRTTASTTRFSMN
jgi:hypothetical protein